MSVLKKICFIPTTGYSLFNSSATETMGGAEVDQFTLGKALASRGNYEVTFITREHPGQRVENYDGITVYPGFRLYRSPWKFFLGPWSLWRLYRTLQIINADIYFREAFGMEVGVIALYCRRHGKKFVFRAAHTMDCDGGFAKQEPLTALSYRYGLRLANTIITQTHEQQAMLKQHEGLNSQVIPNAYELPKFFENHAKQPSIIWVGRLNSIKQPRILLALADRLPHIQFIFVGTITREDPLFGQQILDEAKTRRNISIVTGKSYKQMPGLYDSASLLVSTSSHEGFPATFIEAMSHGLPIVSLNINPDNFLVISGAGRLSGTFEQLVHDANEIITNNDLRQEYSLKARAYVEKHHDIQKFLPEYEKIFYS